MIGAELDLDVDIEAERVVSWRSAELERAGYEASTARDLAERTYIDLHRATALLRHGCPAETAVRILV
jgi:hypothetical protein